jgi:hypothetical protein
MPAPPASPIDEEIHRVLVDALERAGCGGTAEVSFQFVESANVWMTEVRPLEPRAAPVIVWAEADSDLNLTVGRTWLEVWALEDPGGWLHDLMDAVIAGDVTEVSGASADSASRIWIDSRRGVLGGGDLFVTPWPWRRTRQYSPYG